MWAVEHSEDTPATPEVVWHRYADIASWPEWNAAVGKVELSGPFATGSSGTLAPPGQGPLPFRVVEATVNQGYTSETDIAETVTLRSTNRLSPLPGGGTRITHRVELVGPAAEFFARSFGPVLSAGVPKTVEALAHIAAKDAARPPKRALLVLTSHDTLGDTGRSTGAYMSEVAEAWKVFSDSGYKVDLVSVQGGKPPLEAVNKQDPVQRAFLDNPRMSKLLADTPRPADVNPGHYAVVFVAGGHGAAWDLPNDKGLAELIREVYEWNGVISAVCHGPAGLLNVTLSDGSHLVAGKRVAAFTNDEERAVGMTDIVPFLLADALVERGARYDAAPSFIPHVVVDGRLVTGQNPASATDVAKAAVDAVTR
ncbi:MAG TPA: DJ-1/PfpI family protein [Micromonosporaceae bacterium]